MGEIVLIIDADTIVPEDCFRDAAREMFESPDCAIIQHESGTRFFFGTDVVVKEADFLTCAPSFHF